MGIWRPDAIHVSSGMLSRTTHCSQSFQSLMLPSQSNILPSLWVYVSEWGCHSNGVMIYTSVTFWRVMLIGSEVGKEEDTPHNERGILKPVSTEVIEWSSTVGVSACISAMSLTTISASLIMNGGSRLFVIGGT